MGVRRWEVMVNDAARGLVVEHKMSQKKEFPKYIPEDNFIKEKLGSLFLLIGNRTVRCTLVSSLRRLQNNEKSIIA